jgi:MFS family permease
MVAHFVRLLGTSLAMDAQGFSAAAISSTGAAAGAIVLPLMVLVSWLSDRLGRKRFLALAYLLGTASLLVLSVSVSVWHFWIVACLGSLMINVNLSVGSALVADLVPQAALGRGMSLFTTMLPAAGVIGFTATGQAVQSFGMTSTFTTSAFLPLAAILLLIPIRAAQSEESVARVAPA